MKTQSTTQKAEEKHKNPNPKSQNSRQELKASVHKFLDQLRGFLRTATEQSSPEISPMAREWERVINSRILVSLQARERRVAAPAKREAQRMQLG